MSDSKVLDHLAKLVGFDTRNPPRNIDGDSPVIQYCQAILGSGFEVSVTDHGNGHVSLFAVRGRPEVLFNVHLDTVPHADDWRSEGWTSDPMIMRKFDDKVYGRGVCDIKGAAAALLDIAEQGPDRMALLFTTDEEGAGGCCVRNFLESGAGGPFSQIVVAEPTACNAILGHRGYLSVKGKFSGDPGHSSEARALEDSAVHQFSIWATRALDVARQMKTSTDDPGSCFNIGRVEGGTKSNVIAGELDVHWSARLRPGQSNGEFLSRICDCAQDAERVTWRVPFTGEPLPGSPKSFEASQRFAAVHEIPLAADVDFWTEASIFSEFGLPALVLGPGHIVQAHSTDEWLAIEQLELARNHYSRIISNDR